VVQVPILTFLAISVYCIGLDWEVGSWLADTIRVEQGLMTPGIVTHHGACLVFRPRCSSIASFNLAAGEFAVGVRKARTMCILFICFAELQRAFSCRALRESVFTIGYFTNRVMAIVVPASLVCCVFIAVVPGVMGVFDLEYISGRGWALLLCLSTIPFLVDETTKLVYRRTGWLKRPVTTRPDALLNAQSDVPPPLPPIKSVDTFQRLNDLEVKEN